MMPITLYRINAGKNSFSCTDKKYIVITNYNLQ